MKLPKIDYVPPVFYGPQEQLMTPLQGEPLTTINSILAERDRQNQKWGEQNHSIEWWLAILGEEFGELCQCALHQKFNGHKAGGLREEAVQVAAVALAIVECLDRNG